MNDKGISYFVEESLSKQWYFYISEKQRLCYTYRDNENWSEPMTFDGQLIKFFSVTIDSKDTIYILAYTNTKQLHYYEWDGYQWLHRTIYRVSSRFEDISYITMVSTISGVHFFYYIENSLKRAQEALVHYYLHDGNWKRGELLNFLSDEGVSLQTINSNFNGDLYLIYTKRLQNVTHCYYNKLDNKASAWSNPVLLFQKLSKCSGYNSFIDSSGDIHLVWKEQLSQKFNLYYQKTYTGDVKNSTMEVLLHTGAVEMEYLSVFGKNKFYCCWLEDGKGMFCMRDLSQIWQAPKDIPYEALKPYMHISKTLDDQTHAILLLGDGHPNYKWSIQKLEEESIAIQENKQKDVNIDYHSNAALHQQTTTTKQSLEQLVKRIDEFSSKMDDIYTALYQIQEHIQQRDKSIYQMDSQVKKLSFDIEQFRIEKARSKDIKPRVINYGISEALPLADALPPVDAQPLVDNLEPNNIEPDIMEPLGEQQKPAAKENKIPVEYEIERNEEIFLGNVSIVINPEETE